MKDLFRLDGKVAVVIGGAGGIGRELLRRWRSTALKS